MGMSGEADIAGSPRTCGRAGPFGQVATLGPDGYQFGAVGLSRHSECVSEGAKPLSGAGKGAPVLRIHVQLCQFPGLR